METETLTFRGTCEDCAKPIMHPEKAFTTGYGTIDGKKVCFACCGERDRKTMQTEDRITLYFFDGKITNWPGTLEFKPNNVLRGKHNFAGTQRIVYFRAEGKVWMGRNVGDHDLLHCKVIKRSRYLLPWR